MSAMKNGIGAIPLRGARRPFGIISVDLSSRHSDPTASWREPCLLSSVAARIILFGWLRSKGAKRERVTIIFNQEKLEVEVHQSSDQTSYRSFSIDLNSSGQVCLMDDKKELSIEKFTELALRGLLFPREF
jgi:hypothetical protein